MSNRKRKSEATEEEKNLVEFLFGKDILKTESVSNVPIHIDKKASKSAAVWEDDDDEDLEIDLDDTNRLKKLKQNGKSIVSGRELSTSLRERFSTNKMEWANVKSEKQPNDEDLLLQAGSMVEGGDVGKSGQPIPQGQLDIKRLANANIVESSKKAIHAVNFHENGDLLLVAGEDKHLRFFNIDGEKNDKQLSVKFDMAIFSARFRGGSNEVVLSGRTPYFYGYDAVSGSVSKFPCPPVKKVTSLEHMTMSPEGGKLAFFGTHGGYIHIVHGTSKQWVTDLKMNCPVRSAYFLDETHLVTSGLDADIYQWDLRMNSGRCVSRFQHDDGSCTSCLSAFNPHSYTSAAYGASGQYQHSGSSYLAVGAESGAVSIFGASTRSAHGVFDFNGEGSALDAAANSSPKQLKTVMNLTTKITSCAFHPSGQILAIASSEKRDQLKMVHLPSNTVFTNWPTERTPFNHVECMDFSLGGGYFAVGNNRGKVLLYKLNHFSRV